MYKKKKKEELLPGKLDLTQHKAGVFLQVWVFATDSNII